MKKRQVLSTFGLAAVGAVTVIFFQNCAGKMPMPSQNRRMMQSSVAPLALHPDSQNINVLKATQVVATGGVPPYSYSLAGCASKVDPKSGIFTAAPSKEDCVVIVEDSNGQQTYGVMQVGPALSVRFDPHSARVGAKVLLTPTGGKAPYRFSLLQGAGMLRDNVYLAPRVSETAVLLVTDSLGLVSTVTLTIQPSPVPAMTANVFVSGPAATTP